MKRILLTGGSGFVGSRFLNRWHGQGYEVLAPGHKELDITDADAVLRYMQTHRPDVVLHTAAISNTGYCESHPEESYVVNTLSTIQMAQSAKNVGAGFVFFSSDQIYNGNTETGLLNENISVSPVNHYGRHKLEAEQRVLEFMPEAVMLRATWMYDIPRPGMPAHPNFFTNIRKAISEANTISFAIHEHRGITHIDEVVEQLPLTFSLPGGVYNYGAENLHNTFDTAYSFVEQWKSNKVASASVIADMERFAQQPRNISISIAKIREASNGRIDFTETLEGLIQSCVRMD